MRYRAGWLRDDEEIMALLNFASIIMEILDQRVPRTKERCCRILHIQISPSTTSTIQDIVHLPKMSITCTFEYQPLGLIQICRFSSVCAASKLQMWMTLVRRWRWMVKMQNLNGTHIWHFKFSKRRVFLCLTFYLKNTDFVGTFDSVMMLFAYSGNLSMDSNRCCLQHVIKCCAISFRHDCHNIYVPKTLHSIMMNVFMMKQFSVTHFEYTS